MRWDRRKLLKLAGAASVPLVAGCTGAEQNNADETPAGSDSGEEAPASPPDSQQAKLAADDGNDYDSFGGSVALTADGETALIGASGEEEPNGPGGGAVYTFRRTDGDWSQQTKFTPEDVTEGDYFGNSVALSDDGETALVGAFLADSGSGAAYILNRSDGGWNQQSKLDAGDGDENDRFGRAVALTGDGGTALIGADNDGDPNGESRYGNGAGSAYIFGRSGGSWDQEAKIAANDGEGGDLFGWSVAISGETPTALVGCVRRDAAYVFTRTDGTWKQRAKLADDGGEERTGFGSSLAIDDDGTTALVGSFMDSDPNGEKAGSAYVYTGGESDWSERAKIVADDGDQNDNFAHSVALSSDGRLALAGADPDEDPHGEGAGAAYVFTRDGDDWTQRTKLAADDGDERDRFGIVTALANRGGTALIGAPGDEGLNGDDELSGAGSAYMFG
jgi:hypothetical protein